MTTRTLTLGLATLLVVAACGTTLDEGDTTPGAPDTPTTSSDSPGPNVANSITTTTSRSSSTSTTVAEPASAEVLVFLVGGPDADPNLTDCREV